MASVVSNLVRKISSLRSKKTNQQQNEEESGQLSKLENILMEVQKILIWEDPLLSCCCIVSVNIVFWLIIYLDFNLYGIIFTAMLIITFQQLWMDHISQFFNKNDLNAQQSCVSNATKASDSRNFNSSEINRFLKKGKIMITDAYVRARLLRQTQPGMFCILTCLGFLLLNVIGRSMSDIMTLYILLMLTMTVPGVFFHFMPPCVISSLSNFIYSSRKESDNDNDEVEPYLPETNQEALELLRLAGDLQLPSLEDDEESNDLLLERISGRTSDTTESVCSKMSFYPESSIMPSPENSMDFLEFDLGRGESEKSEINPSENNDINFQSKHFDGDSSDEEEFARGLNLTEKPTKKRKEQEEQKMGAGDSPSVLNAENLISVGTNLLKTALQQTTTNNDRESSSDTDSFEMISEEDL